MLTAKQRHALALAKRIARSLDGVQGIDFGYAYRNRKRTRRCCIRFHMARKVSTSSLAADQVIPEELAGVPTDVLDAAYSPHASPFTAVEVLQPGISIGNSVRRGTGTLGGIVRDRTAEIRFLLSNWHVLCAGPEAEAGDEVSQPGPRHLGPNLPRKVAALERWIAPSDGFDAAIARLDPEIEYKLEPLDAGLRPRKVVAPELGMKVTKSGVASGVTHAMIDGVGGSYRIPYAGFGDTERWMSAMRLVPDPLHPAEEISLAGDCGALWLQSGTGHAIGLHFAGEDGLGPLHEYALAQPLERVFELLNVTLIN